MKKPCCHCNVLTEYRESSSRKSFFCDYQCLYLFSAGGGEGKKKESRDWSVVLSFTTTEGWKEVIDFIEYFRKNPFDSEMEKRREKVIDKFGQWKSKDTTLLEIITLEVVRINYLEDIRREKLNLAKFENYFKIKPLPIDQPYKNSVELGNNFDKYLAAVESYKITITNLVRHIDELYSLVTEGEDEINKKISESTLPIGKNFFRGETRDNLVVHFIPLQRERLQLIETVTRDFERDFPIPIRIAIDDSDTEEEKEKKEKTEVDMVSVEEEEEEDEDEMNAIVIDRVEVSTGMTQQQMDVFQDIKERIRKIDLITTGCDASVKKYLAECDIIMHLPLHILLNNLVQKRDTYLRNMFEVGRSRGNNDQELRRGWESKIFQSTEYDSFSPHDKVKYAAVNWARTKKGVPNAARIYGQSYIVFKSAVKERCTYSRYDSSSNSVRGTKDLATKNYMCSIAKKFSLKEIDSMVYYMYQQERQPDPTKENPVMNDIRDYMEVQIHGELLIERDVSKIMIDSFYRQDQEFLTLLKQYFVIIGREIYYEFI